MRTYLKWNAPPQWSNPAPCTLHPAPCTLHPEPCTLNPVPCTPVVDTAHAPDPVPAAGQGGAGEALPTTLAPARTRSTRGVGAISRAPNGSNDLARKGSHDLARNGSNSFARNGSNGFARNGSSGRQFARAPSNTAGSSEEDRSPRADGGRYTTGMSLPGLDCLICTIFSVLGRDECAVSSGFIDSWKGHRWCVPAALRRGGGVARGGADQG